VPCTFCDAAHLMIGQLTTAQFMLQHLLETHTTLWLDQSHNVFDDGSA
jgi:hypothetical protein